MNIKFQNQCCIANNFYYHQPKHQRGQVIVYCFHPSLKTHYLYLKEAGPSNTILDSTVSSTAVMTRKEIQIGMFVVIKYKYELNKKELHQFYAGRVK